MTVHPTMGNLVRQQLSKIQPRRARPKSEFPQPVKDIMLVRSGGWCEIDRCGPGVHHHHRGPRGAGGSRGGWVNCAANGLVLSVACHLERVESNRAEALENGWLISRNSKQTAVGVPVWIYDPDSRDPDLKKRRRRVLLGDDGSIQEAPEEEVSP